MGKLHLVEEKGYLLYVGENDQYDFMSLMEGTNELHESAVKLNQHYLLADHRKIRFHINLSQAYNLVKYYELKLPEFMDVVMAVVVDERDLEIGKFWESVSIKRGFNYKAFIDYDKAEHWLLGQKEKV